MRLKLKCIHMGKLDDTVGWIVVLWYILVMLDLAKVNISGPRHP